MQHFCGQKCIPAIKFVAKSAVSKGLTKIHFFHLNNILLMLLFEEGKNTNSTDRYDVQVILIFWLI